MVVQTKNFGPAEVIGDGSKYGYLRVRFLQTGHIDEFRKDAIERGEIRDKYAATLCGVGIIGNVKTRGKNKNLYTVWHNMIRRCYAPHDNPAYYNKVTVCERWLTFEYFLADAKQLFGWDEEWFAEGKLALDKDILQSRVKEKVYSPETCIWVSKQTNAHIQDAQQRPFVGVSPDGVRHEGSNITDFARFFGLERRQISAVLHKRFKSTMGWTFHYIDEEIV